MIRCENSEVLPLGSVAVAETRARLRSRREGDVDRGGPGGIRRDLRGTQIDLALDELAGEVGAGRIRVEVQVEGR